MNNNLDALESTILHKLTQSKNCVNFIPIDVYINILFFCIKKEDFETCCILRDILDKVVLKSRFDYYEDFLK